MENFNGKYIGEKKIESAKETEEKTLGGFSIIEVQYESGIEWFSSLMFEKIVSETPCDLSELREKRITPIVNVLLTVLRDWGIKLSELPYMSAVLNQSLDFNQKEALVELWSKWMPRPISSDDIDLITVDRVLHSIKLKTLDDVLKPQQSKTE